MSVLPKFKAIKIKLNDNNNLDINSKGVLTISTCKKEKKEIDVKKLNSTISKIKSNFTEGKKRGPKPKTLDPIIDELIEQTETEQETPVQLEPIRVHKKRGRKPNPIPDNMEPKISKPRGRKPGSKNKPKLNLDIQEPI